MSEIIEEQITDIRKQIMVTAESKNKINRLRRQIEEDHFEQIKRLEKYMNSASLTENEKLDYFEQTKSAEKQYMDMNDEIDDALKMIDKENEEREEKIRELSKQMKEESKEKKEESEEE